jgi:hypothetical protein
MDRGTAQRSQICSRHDSQDEATEMNAQTYAKLLDLKIKVPPINLWNIGSVYYLLTYWGTNENGSK